MDLISAKSYPGKIRLPTLIPSLPFASPFLDRPLLAILSLTLCPLSGTSLEHMVLYFSEASLHPCMFNISRLENGKETEKRVA